jgi:PilZ domain
LALTLPKTSTRHEKAIARIMRNEAAKPPAKPVKRAARRIRQLSAWIVLPGLDDCECQVMDVSADGAKIISAIPSQVPDRFALAFAKGDDKHRLCEVAWRRGKVIGVRFAKSQAD